MYLNFYKLDREPFLLTPDTSFIHLAKPHRDSLIALLNGILTGKGFLVMTGGAGTGKTTVINAVLQCLPRLNKAVSSGLLVNPLLEPNELLEAILDDLGIPSPGPSKPQRLAALQQHLLQVQQRGGVTALVIDEAHLLSPELLEEVRLLGNIDTYSGKLLQIVLSGQPDLATQLLQPRQRALRQRISVMVQLQPLSESDAAAYVEQRLRSGGLKEGHIFTPAAVSEIFRRSHGVPRLINILCATCLELGFENRKTVIDPDLVGKAVNKLVAPTASKTQVASHVQPPNSKGAALSEITLPETLESDRGLAGPEKDLKRAQRQKEHTLS
jgi:general secretion pathway protein A